jgi:hypothetical protein
MPEFRCTPRPDMLIRVRMRTFAFTMLGFLAAVVCPGSQTLRAQGLSTSDASQGLPPRATPADYQIVGKAGQFTIAAEFDGHSVPLAESILTTNDFVVIEAAIFGPAGARLKLAPEDFSLRINGKKMASPAQPAGLVMKSLKDPAYEPLVKSEVGKTKIGDSGGGGGGGGQDDTPPAPPKVPIEVQLLMEKRTKKASMAEGDRALPQAGLLFFEFGGKARSAELIYNGPAGKVTLNLQP